MAGSGPVWDDRCVDGTAPRLVLRPTRTSRVVGWALVGCGVAFAFSATAADGDVAGAILMVVTAALYAGLGVSMATARVTVTPDGLVYRYGLRIRTIPATDIASIDIGPGSGVGYPRLTLRVERRTGRAVRLIALQRPATARSRSLLADRLTAIRTALGATPPL
jgi:hypothetical protein